MRLENGYRAWGSDVGPDHTPVEAGLSWAVKLDTDHRFAGRKAIENQLGSGVTRRLAGFTVDDPDVNNLGRKTIFRDSQRVGWLTSGGWGYTVGANIGYGYVRDLAGVDIESVLAGSYELEVATRRIPCSVHMSPLYDPKMTSVKD